MWPGTLRAAPRWPGNVGVGVGEGAANATRQFWHLKDHLGFESTSSGRPSSSAVLGSGSGASRGVGKLCSEMSGGLP